MYWQPFAEPHRHIKFHVNHIENKINVYLFMAQKTQHKVGVIDMKTKVFRHANVSIKSRTAFTNNFQALYDHIVSTNISIQNRKKLEALLLSLIKCCVMEYVVVCMHDFKQHYNYHTCEQQIYNLVQNFIDKIRHGCQDSVIVDSVEFHRAIQKYGDEFCDLNANQNIKEILTYLDSFVESSINHEHKTLIAKMDKLHASLSSYLKLNNLDTIISRCSKCRQDYVYFVHEKCDHTLCLKCAVESIKSKQCVKCTNDDNNDSTDIEDESHTTSLPSSKKQPAKVNSPKKLSQTSITDSYKTITSRKRKLDLTAESLKSSKSLKKSCEDTSFDTEVLPNSDSLVSAIVTSVNTMSRSKSSSSSSSSDSEDDHDDSSSSSSSSDDENSDGGEDNEGKNSDSDSENNKNHKNVKCRPIAILLTKQNMAKKIKRNVINETDHSNDDQNDDDENNDSDNEYNNEDNNDPNNKDNCEDNDSDNQDNENNCDNTNNNHNNINNDYNILNTNLVCEVDPNIRDSGCEFDSSTMDIDNNDKCDNIQNDSNYIQNNSNYIQNDSITNDNQTVDNICNNVPVATHQSFATHQSSDENNTSIENNMSTDADVDDVQQRVFNLLSSIFHDPHQQLGTQHQSYEPLDQSIIDYCSFESPTVAGDMEMQLVLIPKEEIKIEDELDKITCRVEKVEAEDLEDALPEPVEITGITNNAEKDSDDEVEFVGTIQLPNPVALPKQPVYIKRTFVKNKHDPWSSEAKKHINKQEQIHREIEQRKLQLKQYSNDIIMSQINAYQNNQNQ